MNPSKSSESKNTPRLLPPLVSVNEGASTSGVRSQPRTPDLTPSSYQSQPWSYFHRGCVVSEAAAFPANSERGKKRNNRGDVVEPTFVNVNTLEDYVLENVDLITIQKWLFKKTSMIHGTAIDVQLPKYVPKISQKQLFMNLMNTLQGIPDENAVIWEMAKCVTDSIGVDAFRVYKLIEDQTGNVQCLVMDQAPLDSSQDPVRADPMHEPFVLEAAQEGISRCLNREYSEKFPETPVSLFRKFHVKNVKEANAVLYQPILTSIGATSYVIEMWRARNSFAAVEQHTSNNFLLWGSLALYYYKLYMKNLKGNYMMEFLLGVVKDIFEKMVSLDELIKRILEFAQKLVSADRASLFLVDSTKMELVSTVFDLKFEPGQTVDVEKKEIRMPISRGIAGHVASSGETMNIPDAYVDPRFNREVDEATGYKTTNILCMPIKVQGEVIGVVQMVNKRNSDSFHREDERAFEVFATFFGLALHHARLYDTIMRKEQMYKVTLEVLSYHNTCRENEVQAIMGDVNHVDVALDDFYLDPYKLDEFEKCKAVIVMFDDLFDMTKFDKATVTRFVLTVKKNYRTVPYHNFDHGWSVAHAMYVILKNDVRGRFDYKMRLALFVASLCHDLDHRGYTNKYMSETASPLAAMYTTSTLEHHHFNITVTILQQDGHNIFSNMSSEAYKVILGFIRQCILATDLAAFFPNLDKMKELQHGKAKFCWALPSHRDLAMAISMTSADLSASAKPWEVQNKTVKVIFEEFYDQGDKERAADRTPIPMMDRNKPDEQPSSQIGFLSQICIPCYNVLYRLLPKTKPMYIMALKNLYHWKSKAARIQNRRNGEEVEEFEIEDVSEEILLNGEPELTDEDERDDEDEEGEGDVGDDEKEATEKKEVNQEANKVLPSEEETVLLKDIKEMVSEEVAEELDFKIDKDLYDVVIKEIGNLMNK